MRKRMIALFAIGALFLAGCNLKTAAPSVSPTPIEANQGQPIGTVATAVASPTETPTLGGTQASVLPSETPTATLTVTVTAAMVTPKTEAVNCRFGPGTNYVSTGGLKTGATVPILGQNGDGTWWQIQNPNNVFENCWVSAIATNTSGNMASVPVAASPQPFVTLATINPIETISVAGCVGPVQPIALTGSIDVNGPTAVTYHFETQQGGALPNHTLTLSKYGPVTVTESFTPAVVAGTFWVKLFITAPNSLTAEEAYTITCP